MQAAAGFDFYHVAASSPGGSIDYLLGRTDQPNSNSVGDYRNVLFYLGNKEDLTEEEAEFIKETLVTYRKVKGKY